MTHASFRWTTVTLTFLLLPSQSVFAQGSSPSTQSCPQSCTLRPNDAYCNGTYFGSCCCDRLPHPLVQCKSSGFEVQIEQRAPTGIRYWLAEWDNERARATVTSLEHGEPRRSSNKYFEVLAVESPLTVAAEGDAVRRYLGSNRSDVTMYSLTNGQQCRPSGPRCTEATKALTTCSEGLNVCNGRNQEAEKSKRACEDDRNRERIKVIELSATIQSRDLALSTCEHDRDQAGINVQGLTDANKLCKADLQDCQQRLRPSWLKWTALTVATLATVWTAWEAKDLWSANKAYNDAPAGSQDLGARHVAVVEAKGRLATAGVASLLGWVWSASLVEW
jgi:hypothetical protein